MNKKNIFILINSLSFSLLSGCSIEDSIYGEHQEITDDTTKTDQKTKEDTNKPNPEIQDDNNPDDIINEYLNDKQKKLLDDKRELESEGIGYTYLNYNLETKFKSWDDLISENYLSIDINTIKSNKLDELGKGILEFPNNEYIGNDNNEKGVFGDNMFLDAIKLNTQVNFPCGLINGNKNIRRVILPLNMTNINAYSFANCPSLSKINNISTSIQNLGDYCFKNCISLTELDFSSCNNLKILPTGAFYNCLKLETFNNPNSITQIGNSCFYLCSSLNSINIPPSIKFIIDNAFYNCSNITNITFSSSLEQIGMSSFEGCTKLTNVTINSNNVKLLTKSFKDCTSLSTFDLSQGSISEIGNSTFENCSSLSSLYFQKFNTLSGDRAFYNTGLEEIDLSLVPNIKTTINTSMFENCKNLTTLTLHPNIVKISKNAFNNCASLQFVYNYSQLQIIEENAFNNCSNLNQQMTFETDIAISKDAFNNTKISSYSVIYPSNAQNHFSSAYLKNCTNLKTITISNENYNSIPDEAFYNCSSLETLNLTISYSASLINNNQDNNMFAVGENAFYNCNDLATINFSGTVEQWLYPLKQAKTNQVYIDYKNNSPINFDTNNKLIVTCNRGCVRTNESSVTLTLANYLQYSNQI